MGITNRDQLIEALATGQKMNFYKPNATSEGAGTFHSWWKLAGLPPAGSNPTTDAGHIPTSSTVGAFPFSNPAGGDTSYLLRLAATPGTVGTLVLYDRLWANSGLSGIVTTPTALSTPPDLTRPDALGADTELWAEIYTAIGATAATLTVTYTNQDGTTARSATYAHPANAETVGQMVRLTLQGTDTGVRKVEGYSWSVSTGTAGDFGLVILRRIVEVPPVAANVGMVFDYKALGMPQIYDNACISAMIMCSTTGSGLWMGSFVIGQN